MEIHNDPPARMIDMHIGRGDVRCRDLRQQVVRDCDAAPLRPRLKLSELLGRDVRRLGQETRLGQMEATRGVYRPWPDQRIGGIRKRPLSFTLPSAILYLLFP